MKINNNHPLGNIGEVGDYCLLQKDGRVIFGLVSAVGERGFVHEVKAGRRHIQRLQGEKMTLGSPSWLRSGAKALLGSEFPTFKAAHRALIQFANKKSKSCVSSIKQNSDLACLIS